MSNFNYMPVSPYLNPAQNIEKVTNELPAEKKAVTKAVKKPAKKAKAKRTKKVAKKSK